MRSLTCCILLALATSPAWAATPINQTRPLTADGLVSIENLKGGITVRTWDRPEVKITGSLGEGVEKLVIDGSPQSLSIEVRYPRNGGSWFGGGSTSEPTQLDITVPQGAALNIESVSAEVDVAGSRGKRVSIESVSGDVRVEQTTSADIRIETVSGDQTLAVSGNAVNASTVSGDITVGGRIGGRVRVETVSGDADVTTGTIERLDFSTVSGNGRITTALAADAVLRAESVSGNLSLALPKASSAHIEIETFSGSIRSPIGEVISERYGPGRSLRTTLGDGKADVRMESFSGSVTLSQQ